MYIHPILSSFRRGEPVDSEELGEQDQVTCAEIWRAKKDHDYLCIGVTNNIGKKSHSVLRIRLDRRPGMKILSPARKVIPVKEQVTNIKHLNSTDGNITMLLIAAGRYLEIMHARLDSNSKYS